MKSLATLLLGLSLAIVGWTQPQGEVVDRIIATIGNEIILQSDLEGELIRMRMSGQDPDKGQLCTTFESLMFNKLLLHQARLDSLEVTEGQIQGEIDNRLNYFLNMFGSVEAFEAEYGKTLAQWREDFHDDIRDYILIQQMQYQMNSQVTATPRQVQQFYSDLPKDSIPLISEQVQYSAIVMEPSPSQQQREALLEQADSVRNEVVNGNLTMSIAALRYSDDPGSKYSGGCYRDIPKDQFVPEFVRNVYATEVEQFSPVFETEYGYHFLKVEDKRGDIFSACHVLFSPKVDDYAIVKTQNLLDSVVVKVKEDSLTFESAALRYSTDEQTKNQNGKMVNAYQGGFSHSVDNLDRNIFLVLDKLQPGEISESIMLETPTGNPYFAAYRLDERQAAHQANLKEDYLMFKQQTEAMLQQEQFEKWVNKKINSTYVSIHTDYKDCQFEFPWLRDDS